MKKILFSLIICIFLFATALPSTVHALKPSKFKKTYYGTWELKEYCTDGTDDGTIQITISKLNRKGKIKEASVWWSNNYTTYAATGKIFRKNGVRRIRLNYSNADAKYIIRGKITTKIIDGKYIHEYYPTDCHFWGTVNLES